MEEGKRGLMCFAVGLTWNVNTRTLELLLGLLLTECVKGNSPIKSGFGQCTQLSTLCGKGSASGQEYIWACGQCQMAQIIGYVA